MKNSVLFFLFLCVGVNLQAQNGFNLRVDLVVGEQPIVLDDQTYQIKNSEVIISTLKFYLSNVQFINNGEIVWAEEESFHLINAEKPETKSIKLSIPDNLQFDEIQLSIGVDSVTNMSGAFGGDLDPTNGMYWAWNSGYINFKLEGSSPICPTRKNQFHFHLGGFAAPYASMQTLRFPAQRDDINIAFDIKQFLESIDLREQHSIMMPSEASVLLSQQVKQSVTVK